VFLQNGFVKIGAISPGGHEVICDVRKGADVVGELGVSEQERLDRAVALEQTDAILVPANEVLELLQANPEFVPILLGAFCQALKEAYAQVNTLALDDTIHRVITILIGLGTRIGQRSGSEIPTTIPSRQASADGCTVGPTAT